MSLVALIDGDIIKYSVGFACQKTAYLSPEGTQITIEQAKGGMRCTDTQTNEVTEYPGYRSKKAVLDELGGQWDEKIIPEPVRNVCFTVKRMVEHILKRTGASDYTVYLSKGDCYRVGIYPEYKANRKNIPKPYHVQTIEDYLIEHHPTEVCTAIEADDAMGIRQAQACLNEGERTIICSLDKDLQMIPGWHFNWDKNQLHHVAPEEGLFNFWCQVLTGDATDNIPGLQGVGKKTAEKLLADCKPDEFKQVVLNQYSSRGISEGEMRRNAMLLWILRKPLEETYGKSYDQFMPIVGPDGDTHLQLELL